jgi:hypothetical protein
VGNSLENEVDLMVVDGYGLFDLMARCSWLMWEFLIFIFFSSASDEN